MYTNRLDAILNEIVTPIKAGGTVTDVYAEYDIDAIQDEVLNDYSEGYTVKVTPEQFWEIVEKHAK